MPPMDLKLSDEMLRTIVAAAIWEQIEPADREKMVTEALKQLMVPQATPYSGARAQSRLETVMETALMQIVRDILQEKLNEPVVRERIQTVVTEAFDRIFEKEVREKLLDRMATAFVDAIRVEKY